MTDEHNALLDKIAELRIARVIREIGTWEIKFRGRDFALFAGAVFNLIRLLFEKINEIQVWRCLRKIMSSIHRVILLFRYPIQWP